MTIQHADHNFDNVDWISVGDSHTPFGDPTMNNAGENVNVRRHMKGDDKTANGDALALDNVKGYIEVPNAWNQFRFYDFGFSVTFKADDPAPAASVVFTNTYKKAADVPTPATSKPEKPGKSGLPKTGDASLTVLLAIIAAAAVCIALGSRKARRGDL